MAPALALADDVADVTAEDTELATELAPPTTPLAPELAAAEADEKTVETALVRVEPSETMSEDTVETAEEAPSVADA